jgi:AcrR family transcriptional regulator
MRRKASTDDDARDDQNDVRRRIVVAGAALLAKGGRDALTTRAVVARARVQAPTIYRLFGDKDGLLEAVAEHVLMDFVSHKATRVLSDPLDDLRQGWDLSVAFGLAHPGVYLFLNAEPRPERVSPAGEAGLAMLRNKVEKLAQRGLLRVPVERAVNLIRASGLGTVMTLLGQPEAQRDPDFAAFAREAMLAAIMLNAPVTKQPGSVGAAIALRASLTNDQTLTAGERLLLGELLDRLSATPAST